MDYKEAMKFTISDWEPDEETKENLKDLADKARKSGIEALKTIEKAKKRDNIIFYIKIALIGLIASAIHIFIDYY